ncbi:kinase-like domain-containing protein, partial [Linnemannia elongata]
MQNSALQSQATLILLSSAQAEVYLLGGWRGQTVCVKMPLKGSKEGNSSLSREVEIHRRLTDRHIIQFYDSEYVSEGQERRLRLVMEYAEGEGLDEAIKAGKLLWCDKERIAGEIAHGLSYLHSQGIIHCDIKSKNILLTKKLEVKICDFGSAMTTQDKKDRKKCSLGTKEWMAPEFSRDHTAYSPASDIYALGVIMWEMASSKEANDAIKVQEEKPEDVPHEYLRIMQACCDEDPNNRPGAREI